MNTASTSNAKPSNQHGVPGYKCTPDESTAIVAERGRWTEYWTEYGMGFDREYPVLRGDRFACDVNAVLAHRIYARRWLRTEWIIQQHPRDGDADSRVNAGLFRSCGIINNDLLHDLISHETYLQWLTLL